MQSLQCKADLARQGSVQSVNSENANSILQSYVARSQLADNLQEANSVLQKYFGHRALRPFQREAVEAWRAGRDVLAVLATGAGKSMCFQIPPLLCQRGRWALVISPLVALMQDQVRTLLERGIPAGMCGSGATGDMAASWGKIAAGAFRVVYMTPEFALSRIDALSGLKEDLCLLAVDEAHCISSWGHDFRPQFRELGKLRLALSCVPVMCMTATCRPEVRADIIKSMNLKTGACCIAGSMNRANLQYAVKPRTTFASDLAELFDARPPGGLTHGAAARKRLAIDNAAVGPTSSSIIYVPTKKKSEEVAAWLTERGVPAAAYHAGLGMAERRAAHAGFMSDEVQVVVATVAFGMGIDKPSIRRILHYGAVQTLEHYVQQCGRAGRDGDEAECIAFIKPQDASEGRSLILRDFSNRDDDGGKERCERMLHLNAELNSFMGDESQCRRVRLLRHFGEAPIQWTDAGQAPKGECIITSESCRASCEFCDVCLRVGVGVDIAAPSGDFSEQCRIIIRCVEACEGFTGTGFPCQVAAGINDAKVRAKGLHKKKAFGSGGQHSLSWWKAFLPHVRQRGLLEERPKKLASGFAFLAIAVAQSGQQFLEHSHAKFLMEVVPAELRIYKATVSVPTPARAGNGDVKVVRSCAVALSADSLYKLLFQRRLEWQRSKNVLNELIVSNDALRHFAIVRPSTPGIAKQHVQGLPLSLSEDLLQKLLEETDQFCKAHALKMDTAGPFSDVPSTNHASAACAPAGFHRSSGSSMGLGQGKRPYPDVTCWSEGNCPSVGMGASGDWLGKKTKTAASLDLEQFQFTGSKDMQATALSASRKCALQPQARELGASGPAGGDHNPEVRSVVTPRCDAGWPPKLEAGSGYLLQPPAAAPGVFHPTLVSSGFVSPACPLFGSCVDPAPRLGELPGQPASGDLRRQPSALCAPVVPISFVATADAVAPAEPPVQRQGRALPWACTPIAATEMPRAPTPNDPMPAIDSDDELMMAADAFEARTKERPQPAADVSAPCCAQPCETGEFSSDDQSILLLREYDRMAKENAELKLQLAALAAERAAPAAQPHTEPQTAELLSLGHVADAASAEDSIELITLFGGPSDGPLGTDDSSLEFLHHTAQPQERTGVAIASEDIRSCNRSVVEPVPAPQAENMLHKQSKASLRRASEWSPNELHKMLCQSRLEWQRANNLYSEPVVSNDVLRAFASLRPSSSEFSRTHIPHFQGATFSVNDDLLQRLIEDTKEFCEAHGLDMDVAVGPQSSSPCEVKPEERSAGAQPAGDAGVLLSAMPGIELEGSPADFPSGVDAGHPRSPHDGVSTEDADWLLLLGD